jgi:hypothetical protein
MAQMNDEGGECRAHGERSAFFAWRAQVPSSPWCQRRSARFGRWALAFMGFHSIPFCSGARAAADPIATWTVWRYCKLASSNFLAHCTRRARSVPALMPRGRMPRWPIRVEHQIMRFNFDSRLVRATVRRTPKLSLQHCLLHSCHVKSCSLPKTKAPRSR